MNRLVIVPDENLEPVVLSLRARLAAICQDVHAGNLADVIDDRYFDVLRIWNNAGSTREIIVWGRTEYSFVAVWTSLASESDIARRATAELREGAVARAFESREPECDAAAESEFLLWTNVEALREKTALTVLTAPLVAFGRSIGVVSMFEYTGGSEGCALPEPSGFLLNQSAGLLSTLVEDGLIRAVLGLEK